MAATDHDTTGAVREVQEYAREHGIQSIAGIEITAADGDLDIHVLGYFIEPEDAALESFLVAQRGSRVARVQAISERLAALGYPVDIEAELESTHRNTPKAIGRPQIARAMVAAGYVADVQQAFDKWLGRGCAAFVARTGPTTESVIATIHAAGGLASLAHPGRTRIDGRIKVLRDAGLDAIEAFHSDHDARQVTQYTGLARQLGCLVTGGSDFHGEPSRQLSPGSMTLPSEEWERLRAASARHR